MKRLLIVAVLAATPVVADEAEPRSPGSQEAKESAEVWCSALIPPPSFGEIEEALAKEILAACRFGYHHGYRNGYGAGRSHGFTTGFKLGRGAP